MCFVRRLKIAKLHSFDYFLNLVEMGVDLFSVEVEPVFSVEHV